MHNTIRLCPGEDSGGSLEHRDAGFALQSRLQTRVPAHGFGVVRKPPDLAAQIEAFHLDVLALEEIDDTEDGDSRATNQVLDQTFDILNQNLENTWTYLLFAKRRCDPDVQHTGLAWNRSKVQSVGRRVRVPVTDVTTREFAEWDRHPHAMKFTRGSGRTDFVVIPIHMKAGRNAEALEQREKEVEALVVELDELRQHFQDEDIILIGDFNMGRRSEPAERVYRGRDRLFDLNYSDRSTHISGRPLDRCYIPRSQSDREFSGVTRLQIAAPGQAAQNSFRRDLSDHWPIVVEFAEQADDD